MATRTTTTARTRAAPAPSADHPDADFTLEQLAVAYFDCRRSKRNTPSALVFEQHLERNLIELHDELQDGSYKPGRSICFVVTRPKAREVWAADFRDRVVHHLLYNKISPRFYASFIKDTCACIPGRGTMYAAKRLEAKIRSVTQNWARPAFYLKCDLANFFVAIDKDVLRGQIAARVSEPWWLRLAENPAPECGSWLGYMRMSVAQVASVDCLVMLPGWPFSKGARIEYLLAKLLGLGAISLKKIGARA